MSKTSKTNKRVSPAPRLCSRKIFFISVLASLMFIFSIFLFQNRLYHVNDSQLLVSDNALERFKRSNQSRYFQSKLNNATLDSKIHVWIVKDKSGISFSTGLNESFHLSDGSIMIGNFNKSSFVMDIEYPFSGRIRFASEEHVEKKIMAIWISYEHYIDIFHTYYSTSTVSESLCNEASALVDTDFKGNDVSNTENVDIKTCCLSCAANPSCTHWTHVQGSKSCWMKGGIAHPTPIEMPSGSGLSSGIMPSKRNQLSLQKEADQLGISSDNSINLDLPPCSTMDASNKDTWRQGVPISSTTIRRNVTNGDWLQQFPLGNGQLGAFVGGNVKSEIIPFSLANWFTYKPSDKSKSEQRKKTMGAHYALGREKLKEGHVPEAISELSNVQVGGLGMFQYLADLMFTFSTLPFMASSLPTQHNRIYSPSRASYEEWKKSMFEESIEAEALHSIPIISENSLDMISGIAFETHMELHMQPQNKSSASSVHWISAVHREWFVSAVDNVFIGKIHCKLLNSTDSKFHCVNVALGIIRQFTDEESIPSTTYTISDRKNKEIDVFDLNFAIASSNHLFVPTTHFAVRMLCHQSEKSHVMGVKGQSDVGYTDSPMAVCNNAAHVDIIAAVESIDTLGDDNPEAFDASKAVKEKLKRACWDRINLASKKGFWKVRSDHVHYMKSAMKSVQFSLHSNSEVGVSPPLGEVVSDYLSQFGQGCVDERTKQINEESFDRTLVSQLYTFGRYLQLSSSQKHVPNLQGIWGDGNKAEWNGDYHLNINFQMMYWSAASAFPISSNHAVNLLHPLVTFLKRLSNQGKQVAQIMYKEVMKTSKHSSSLSENSWVAHGFTDSTLRGDVMADLQWSLCVTCGAWAANHLFDIVLYSNIETIDNQTLEDILNVFRGLAEFFNSYLFSLNESEQTVLHTGPTTSPENSYTMKGNNIPSDATVYLTFTPAIDVSILREVSSSYYLAAKWISSLPTFKPSFNYLRQAEEFQNLVANMPNRGIPLTYEAAVPLTPTIASNAAKRGISNHPTSETVKTYSRIREYTTPLKEANGHELDILENVDLGHRHFSLLHWLYPAQFLPFTTSSTVENNNVKEQEALYNAAKGSLHLKRDHFGGHTSWSAVWEASLWARLGDGEESFTSLKHMISRYLTPNLLSLHPPLDIVGPNDCHTCFSDIRNKQLEEQKRQKPKIAHRRLGTISHLNEEEHGFVPPPMGDIPINYHHKAPVDTDEQKIPALVEAKQNSPNLRRESSPRIIPKQHSNSIVNRRGSLVTRQRGLVTDRGDKFQLDGNLGYLAAIHEMLVQSYLPRRVILLPAVPSSWREGGELLGLGIRGNAQLSMSWKDGKVQFLSVVFHSLSHPWWSHRIEERKDQPGFYEDQLQPNSPTIELSIAGPNSMYFLPKAYAAQFSVSFPPLCDMQQEVEGKWCSNCAPLPHQEGLHVRTIAFDKHIRSSANTCTLLACDQDISQDICWKMFVISQTTTMVTNQ